MSEPAQSPLARRELADLLRAARTVDAGFARDIGTAVDEALRTPAPEALLRERIARTGVPPVFADLLECALASAEVVRAPLRALPPPGGPLAAFLRSPWRGVTTAFPVQHYLAGACDTPLALGRRRTHLAVLREPYEARAATVFEVEDFAFLQRLSETPPVADLLASGDPGRIAGWLGALSADAHVVWLGRLFARR